MLNSRLGFFLASAPASNYILNLTLPSDTINVPGKTDSGSAATQPGKGYLGRSDWLQRITWFLPSRQYMSFAQAIAFRGVNFENVWLDFVAMVGLGLAAFFGSLALFRRSIAATGKRRWPSHSWLVMF